MSALQSWVRDLLRCPQCRSVLSDDASGLVCSGCRLAYPVRDGVPVMLVAEARQTDGVG